MEVFEEVIVNGPDYLLCLFKHIKHRNHTQTRTHTQLSHTHLHTHTQSGLIGPQR